MKRIAPEALAHEIAMDNVDLNFNNEETTMVEKGDAVKFKKDGKFVRGTIDSVFYDPKENFVEGFAVSHMSDHGTEYVTYETKVVFL